MQTPEHSDNTKQKSIDYSNIKITHVEHLSFISYLTKASEDYLIRKIPLLKFPLLLIDIPLSLATLYRKC